jgi:hydrogenase nickel incorporation protein HypA/HybF
MHELSITERILEIALTHGEKAGARKITDLFLVIGDLSSVVDDSVQFYWDLISKDTIAEGAKLNFRRIPTRFRCLECNLEYAPEKDQFSCPNCTSKQVRVIAGEEFFLEAIDVET